MSDRSGRRRLGILIVLAAGLVIRAVAAQPTVERLASPGAVVQAAPDIERARVCLRGPRAARVQAERARGWHRPASAAAVRAVPAHVGAPRRQSRGPAPAGARPRRILAARALAALSSVVVRSILRARRMTPLGVSPAVSSRKTSRAWAREALAATDPREAVRCLDNAATAGRGGRRLACRRHAHAARIRASAAVRARSTRGRRAGGGAVRAGLVRSAAGVGGRWPGGGARTRGPWMRAFRLRDLTLVVVALVALAALSTVGMLVVPATEARRRWVQLFGRAGRRARGLPDARAARLPRRAIPRTDRRDCRGAGGHRAGFCRPDRGAVGQDRRALRQFLERGGVVLAAGRLAAEFLAPPAAAPPPSGSDPGSPAVGSDPGSPAVGSDPGSPAVGSDPGGGAARISAGAG